MPVNRIQTAGVLPSPDRPDFNIVAGSGISLTAADDPSNGASKVTIAVSGAVSETTVTATVSVLTPILDANTAVALAIAPTTATSITLGKNTSMTGAATFGTGTGAVSLNGDTTVATGKSLIGAAGTGAVTLGSMTGDMTLPTGALSWAGASGKTASLVATAAALTITAAAASTWSTSVGALAVDAATALNLGGTAATSVVVGRTGQSLGFYGATAVTKPAASADAHTVAAGSVTGVFTNTTFDGSTGSSAYSVGGIVLALKNLGLIAA